MKYGENYAISVMATFFKGEADKEKVRFHCNVQAPKALWLSSDVLTVILSSMWQNALEACRKVRDKERYIRTHIVYKEGKLLIRCENSFTGELRYGKNGSLLQSTKREHHGQGIPNIQRLAKENGGNCFFEQDEGRFFLTVVLMDKQARGRVGAKKNVSNSDM
jgi:sensor histidine kinase regulating citrate/malate metabolism